MEVSIIITIILVSGLICERILKHCKSSKCCGNSEIIFDQSASAPEFPTLLKK